MADTNTTPLTAQNVTGRAINVIMIWKLAVLELFIMCAITAGTFYLAGTGDEDFAQLSSAARSRFIVGMTLAVLGTVKTFLSTTVSTLKKGGNLPPDPANGNTTTFTRQATQTDTLQTSAPAGK